MFMDERYKRRIAGWLFLFASEFIFPVTVMAQAKSDGGETEYISPLGSIGLGRAVVSFDTKIKLTDKTSDDDVFVDPEGNLNLPRISRVNVFYANFRLARKHQLGLSYFAVNRKSAIIDQQASLGDLLIIRGNASVSDDTKFYFLNYGYSMFLDNRSSVDGLIGIAALDLKETFQANGQLAIKNITLLNRSYYREASIFAPLPLLGLRFRFAFTPKWIFQSKFAFVGGTYKDVRAFVTQSQSNVNYWFTKHFGAVFGFSYFNARTVVEDELKKQEIDYGYTGVFAGLHLAF
jgi:hypothetical protein